MGFDSLLGQYNKGIGLRYSDYLDCVDLCSDCHCEIHYIYQHYVDEWVNRSPKGAARFRHYLIQVCKRWLDGKIKSPKIPKQYLQAWTESRVSWERERDGRA